MIDTFDTSTGVAFDWGARCAAQDRLHAELQPQNQAALFDALATAGVTLIVVTFDGYGDSGQIENIEVKAGDAVVAMPAGEVEMPTRFGTRQSQVAPPSASPMRLSVSHTICSSEPTAAGKTTTAPMAISRSTSPNGRSPSTTTNATPRPNTRSTYAEEAAMGHCYHHALSSVRKWGGVAEDYLPLHQWFDESKAITADFRHRALRHHAEGNFMLERFFGATVTLSTSRIVPVRLIGEQHVVEDLGFIPSFADWVRCIRPEPWMGRAQPIHKQVDPFAAAATAGGA